MTPPPSANRLAKATAGVIGSRTRLEKILQEKGLLEHMTAAQVERMQHYLEQEVKAIADAACGVRAGAAEVRRRRCGCGGGAGGCSNGCGSS